MKIKNSFLIVVAFLLSACNINKKEEIKIDFKEHDKVEVYEKINPCSFISAINKQEISNQLYAEKTSFIIDKIKVECPSEIDTTQLGKQTLLFIANNKQFKKDIEIVDTLKPEIQLKEKYEVSINNEYFDILKLAEVKDNYSKVLSIGLNGKYDITKEGEYDVEVVAVDESKNESKKKTTIYVKNKVVEENQVVNDNILNATTNSNLSNVVSHPSIETKPIQKDNVNTKQKPNQKSGYRKQFLFTDGYNMNNVFNACSNYLNSVGSGLCQPIKKGSQYIGMEYIP